MALLAERPPGAGRSHARAGGPAILRSLIGKLVIVLIVFCAVPLIIYNEFQQADAEKRRLLLDSVREQGRLIAENLRPLLNRVEPSPLIELPAAVERLATADTGVKILFLPTGRSGVEGIYFVASEPPVPPATLAAERDRLIERGVLDNLLGSCAGEVPVALRHRLPDGKEELLTSITPVTTAAGCWAVVTAHDGGAFLGTSIGRPYWQTLEVRIAAGIYLILALLTIGLLLGIWRSLMRFRKTARKIRGGAWPAGGFAAENRVPELSLVAEEFDRMTRALHESAVDIRRAAEDNAHAFKTPIAILRQALEPLRRIVPPGNARGLRAIEVIEESIDRLDHLVTGARQLEETTAELLDPPRHAVDLSRLTERMIGAYTHAYANKGLRFGSSIQAGVVVRAGEDLLETVIENVVDNAVGVCRPGDEVTVELHSGSDSATLTVRDRGPGVPEAQLSNIFERYVSLRHSPAGRSQQAEEEESDSGSGGQLAPIDALPSAHVGIGLWIVRRNLEAVGGKVRAENRRDGGLNVIMSLPLHR